MKKILMALMCVYLVTACASKKEDTSMLSAETLYTKGYRRLNKANYEKAAEYFEKVEVEHPYSKWAVKAKLMGAYAYYKNAKYDDAIMALERFIKYHPGNKDIAYAYYLRGICYYDQINDAKKDQSASKKAYAALNETVYLFPETEYAKDAKAKMNLALDHEAAQEMNVGRFYLRNKNYLSALNRFDQVVQKYQTTVHIEEALYRQVEVYQLIGLENEAKRAAKILNLNYPESSWNKKAQKLLK
ncbi:MAG: outer membrane protein assembly factor BamD [Alphaproteobacteria bacterium]|nr:outer membrane protein assembly factor BamD [Alphaproteobacteria bacterium]